MRSMPWVDDVLRDRVPVVARGGVPRQPRSSSCARRSRFRNWFTIASPALGRQATGQRRCVASSSDELVRRWRVKWFAAAKSRRCSRLCRHARCVQSFSKERLSLTRLTDSPAMRPHVDTDLLIARDHLAIVRDTLAGFGYTEPPMTDGELVFCQFQMTKVDAFGIHHVFDVHWKVSPHTLFAELLTYTEIQANAVAIPALGPQARTTSGAHALLLACVHPVMHHGNTHRLIWLFDIDVLVRRLSAGDLHTFARLAIGKRVAGICARQLSMAGERFSTPIPSEVMQMLTLTPTEPAAVYLRPRRRWHHELFWNVRNLQAWDDRVRLLREVLFPSARYMLDTYRLGSRGVFLLPALYVHRCARGQPWNILVGRK